MAVDPKQLGLVLKHLRRGAEVPDVFLSYSSRDREYALKVKEVLEAHRLTVWHDLDRIGGGDSLRNSIQQGLMLARCGVCLVTPHYRGGQGHDWIDLELRHLLNGDLHPLVAAKIVPLRFEGPPAPSLSMFRHVDCSRWEAGTAERVVGAVRRAVMEHDEEVQRIADMLASLATKLSGSSLLSRKRADERWARVLETLHMSDMRRLASDVQSNSRAPYAQRLRPTHPDLRAPLLRRLEKDGLRYALGRLGASDADARKDVLVARLLEEPV